MSANETGTGTCTGTCTGIGTGTRTGTGTGAAAGARGGAGAGAPSSRGTRTDRATDWAERVATPGRGPEVSTARRALSLVWRAARRVVRFARRLEIRARTGAHDAGMATAEYAIATLAAVGFAGLLVAILRSDEVRGLLLGIVRRALSS